MAVFRARGVAVAAGVPAVFALLAGLLAVAAPGSAAAADTREVVVPSESVAPSDSGALSESVDRAVAADFSPTSSAPGWSVSMPLVRSSVAPMDVSFSAPTRDRVVFLTIDDGVTKDRRALRYVTALRLPVTAFLTTWTIKAQADYFARITRWGSVQNHSATHASMARSTTDLEHEICYSQRDLAATFGVRPWLMRPPYGVGAGRMEVQATARRCGISRIVLWDAVVQDGHLSRSGGSLQPGDVILLHFTPSLAKDLKAAVRAAHRAGLRPASLADYLPAP